MRGFIFLGISDIMNTRSIVDAACAWRYDCSDHVTQHPAKLSAVRPELLCVDIDQLLRAFEVAEPVAEWVCEGIN